jgi:hypothetical protein
MSTLLLTLVMAGGTWIAGWWIVPMAAFGWGILSRLARPRIAGLAGAAAWGALLAGAPWDALHRLAPRLGGIFHLPGWGMVMLTLAFAWLLGWSAARVGVLLGVSLRSASETAPAPRIPAGTG